MNSGSIQTDNFLDRESSLGVLLMLPGLILLQYFLRTHFFLVFGCLLQILELECQASSLGCGIMQIFLKTIYFIKLLGIQ